MLEIGMPNPTLSNKKSLQQRLPYQTHHTPSSCKPSSIVYALPSLKFKILSDHCLILNLFHAIGLSLYPLKTSENLWYCFFFQGV